MGHWCELGALCHDALAVKYGRQHTSNAACAWLLDGRGSMRTGQSRPALLTVLIPDRNLSIPRRSNLASGTAGPGGHPETDFTQKDIFGSKVKGFGDDE